MLLYHAMVVGLVIVMIVMMIIMISVIMTMITLDMYIKHISHIFINLSQIELQRVCLCPILLIMAVGVNINLQSIALTTAVPPGHF